MPDLFDTLVDGVAERTDLVEAAGKRAEDGEQPALVADVEALAADIVRRALQASAVGIAVQMRAVYRHVKAEAAALEKEDPRQIRAITSVDIAARQARQAANADSEL
jgi:Ribonuclease G/E